MFCTFATCICEKTPGKGAGLEGDTVDTEMNYVTTKMSGAVRAKNKV